MPNDENSGVAADAMSARRFATVLGELNEGILVEDEHRRIALVNQAFCSIFQINAPPAALIGADCADAAEQSKGLFKDPAAFVASVVSALAARLPVIGERLDLASGQVLERDYVPVWLDGVYRGHLWKYRDITLQVETSDGLESVRQFYQQVLDSMPAQLAVFDPDSRYRYVTPSAIASAETRDWIVGKTDAEYAVRRGLPPEVGTQRMEMNTRVARTGEQFRFEESFRDREGILRTFARFSSPIRDASGAITFVLGYGLDITDMRAAQREAVEAREQAEAAVKARERFLATMSHEIRTPLNAILGTAYLLETTELTPTQQAYLAAIRPSAEGLLHIISDILDFARIDAGELTFERLPFRPRRVIDALIAGTRTLVESKGLTLHGSVSDRVPDGLIGDSIRLHQVLLNIVANAAKFTEAGGITIEVDAEPSSEGHVLFVVRVRDTGIGIAADQLSRIFEPFVQEREDTTRRFGGTGLGLTIVQELVQRNGGTVDVESTVGVGSTFTVTFTLEVAASESLEPDMFIVDTDGPRLDGARVLLVEDNNLNQLVATELLRLAGADVVVAGNGREAVELLRHDYAFTVVLMDIQMPEMDGFEATRQIRSTLGLSAARLPIVALTASVLLDRRREAAELGMNDFILKPFRPSELRERIARFHHKRTPAYGTVIAPVERAGSDPVLAPLEDALRGPLMDRAQIARLCDGNAALMRSMLVLFLQQCPSQMASLEEALRLDQVDAVRAAAHKLRSGSATVGAVRLALVLEAIEYHRDGPAALRARVALAADTAVASCREIAIWLQDFAAPLPPSSERST